MVEMDSSNQTATQNNNKPAVAQAVPNCEAPFASAVAHEFVRQYYTIMHKSPELLHRFYCQNSVLIHGDLESPEPPSSGLEAIAKRFSVLHPLEISAKIRRLDSMVSVHGDIVVQVSGTLSKNDTRRPFVQTFVLVGETANKYYVCNDIFRYQDSLFDQNSVMSPPPEVVEQTTMVESMTEQVPQQQQQQQTPAPEPEYESEPEAPVEAQEETADVPYEEPMEPEPAQESAQKVVENGQHEEVKGEVKENVDNNPKSYASMLSKPWSLVANSEPAPSKPEPAPFVEASGDTLKQSFVPENKPDVIPQKFVKKASNGNNNNGVNRKFEADRKTDGESSTTDEMNTSGDCQLFVGNLMPQTQAEDLERVFSQYGKIIDIRLNRSNPNKPGVKNYGFISFESSEVIDKIVSMKPIYHEGHRFNVERKDPSVRGPANRKYDSNRQYPNQQRGGHQQSHPPRNGNGNGNIPNNGNNNYRPNQGNAPGQFSAPGSMHRPRNMHFQNNNNNTNRNFAGGKNRV